MRLRHSVSLPRRFEERTEKTSRSRRNRKAGRPMYCERLEDRLVLTGTWSSVAGTMPGGNIGTMLLLSDGSVMANVSGTSAAWYKLTPGTTGSYANGTWSPIALMQQSRENFGSAVLPDGKVLVVGGKTSSAGANTNTGEIYDPSQNTWTAIATPPASTLGAVSIAVLNDGNVLVGDPNSSATYLYQPSNNTWTADATRLNGDTSRGESWVKLRDGSLLSYAIGGSSPQTGQRFVPGADNDHRLDQWVAAASVPVKLDSQGGNSANPSLSGPAVWLNDGRVFWVGASGATAYYDPAAKTWTSGPTLRDASQNQIGAYGSPVAVEPNGKVLIAAGSAQGTTLLEYNPNAMAGNELAIVPAAGGPNLNGAASSDRMLVLPSGQVLFADNTSSLSLYTPDSSPLGSWLPIVTHIRASASNVLTLSGAQLNGISEGATLGSNGQMATNYPIVTITNAAGQVWFLKTSNWSQTGLGNAIPETVDLALPANLPSDLYQLRVIGAGIASQPVSLLVGTGGDDQVTLDDLSITINGTVKTIGADTAKLFVALESGSNTVNVAATRISVSTFIASAGTDVVNVGKNNSVAGILGAVTLEKPLVTNALNMLDTNNQTAHTTIIGGYYTPDALWGMINGMAPALITYHASTTTVSLYGSNAYNTYNVRSLFTQTNIVGGLGRDLVAVTTTDQTFSDRFRGDLDVSSIGTQMTLTVDDSGVNTSTAMSLTEDTIRFPNAPSRGRIHYNSGQVTALKYVGSRNGTTINVVNTGGSNITTIDPGDAPNGTNHVFVQQTTGRMVINNQSVDPSSRDVVVIGASGPGTPGSLAAIQGRIFVDNAQGTTSLILADELDVSARSFRVAANQTTSYFVVSYGAGVNDFRIRGGNGPNTFSIDDAGPLKEIVSGSGNDQYRFSTVVPNPLNIVDNGGSNRLSGRSDVDKTWVINGTNAGQLGNVSFTGINSLEGGTAGDTFRFLADGSLSGSINGISGNDTIDLSALTRNLTLNLGNNSIPTVVRSFGNVKTVNGGTGANAVKGPNAATIYNINSPDAGTIGNLAFKGFGTLTGGNSDDTFRFAKGSSLSGNLLGGGGTDTIDQSAFTSNINANLNTHTINGIAGTFDAIGSIIGGTGANALTGPATAANVTVNAPNSGTIAGAFSFRNYGTLIGGTGNDTFTFTGSGRLSGSVFGAGGTNTLDFSAIASNINANLETKTATPVAAGFSNFHVLIGGTGANALTGPAANSTFNINGANTGTVGGYTFKNFGSLIGNAGDDKFIFAATGRLSGNLYGGSGNNTLDQSALTSNINASIVTQTISGVGGTFAKINTLKGGSGTNTLTGPATGSTFNINGPNAGSIVNGVVFSFSNYATLIGGAGNDLFKFNGNASLSGSVDGAGGTDTLDLSARSTNVEADLQAMTVTGIAGTIAGIDSIIAGTGTNTLRGPSGNTTFKINGTDLGTVGDIAFKNFGTLSGNAGDDTFLFAKNGRLSLNIDGNLGNNTIDQSAFTSNINVYMDDRTISGISGAFRSINLIKGGSGSNALTGPSAGSTFIINGVNSGSIQGVIDFSGYTSLIGGVGSDFFKFIPGGSMSGTVYGGDETDVLDYSAFTTGVNVNLGAWTATGVGGSAGRIESVRGGSGDDTIIGGGDAGVLIGGAGNDTIRGGYGKNIIIGGTGVDSIYGGNNDDVMIGVSTIYDNDDAALDVILNIWNWENDYFPRVNNLRAGYPPDGKYRLAVGSTVIDDLAENIITGGPGIDWYLKASNDTVKDQKPFELIN